MDIQTLITKLEPLMPKKAAHWRRMLDVGDANLKELVEQQIKRITHETFGSDYRNKLLLSLPPSEKVNGSLRLGTVVYDDAKWPFGLKLTDVMQNVAILGRAGSGKTNVAFLLLLKLVSQKVPFIFLDHKRTARHLIPALGKKFTVCTAGRSLSPFPFNPFLVPPGVERQVYVNHLVDVLGDAFILGPGAKSIVHKALRACYAESSTPSCADVLGTIEDLPTKERATGWKMTARRAFESLEFSESMIATQDDQIAFAKSLLTENTVIELDALSQHTKKFMTAMICFWLYSVRLANADREKLRYVIFVEEAHHVLLREQNRAKESLLHVLLRQSRELGIGFVISDQNPHLLSAAALGNCFAKIFLNMNDPSDINRAAGLASLDETEKRFLGLLPIGRGIVKLQGRHLRPFVVQFPLLDVPKGVVTDSVLKQLLNDSVSYKTLRERHASFTVADQRSRDNATTVGEGGVSLLHDIVTHPTDGVDARYQRLGVSADRGNRWKRSLLAHDLVVSEQVRVGNTHRTLLRPTTNARMLLLDYKRDGIDGQASLVHEYWKQEWAQRFVKKGYEVRLEAPRGKRNNNGRMDILATRGPESVAIEIETGKSNVVWNVKRDLLEGVSRVEVVATDEGALKKVERQLVREGLLIRRRVAVICVNDIDGGYH